MHLKTVKDEKMASKGGKVKRNTSAYILYTKDIRDEVKRENPGLKVGDLTLIMSKRWNEAKANNPEIIAKYTKLAEEDKERYISEKEERMIENADDDIVFSDSSSSPSLDLSNRKRCPSAWTLYCKANEKDFMKKHPKLKKREINNLLKSEWEQHVSNKDDIMKKFNAKAKQCLKQLNSEKTKEETDKTTQDNDTIEEDIIENSDASTNTLKHKKHVTFSESVNFEPRQVTDFEKYSMQNRARIREENKHLSPSEITRLLAKLWYKSLKY